MEKESRTMNLKTFDNLVDSGRCYIIAEAGLNHNGSVEIAKQLIDLAFEAGADAVKFQKRTVNKLAIESVLDAKDDRFPEFGSTYREIREHLEFGMEEYKIIKDYTESKGLDFLCTAFDPEAADFLEKLGVNIYKLASHSATNIELLEYLAETGKHTIMSTGMADLEEIDTAVSIFKKYQTPLLLLHCVSAYPTPLEECNLNMINVLSDRFHLPVGYSGHEIGYLPTLSAVAMGAVAIERHYTLDNNLTGFDHKMSLNPQDFIEMVRNIRLIERIKGTGRKEVSDTEWITRKKYHVSAVSSKGISVGEMLTNEMVEYRNPGTGIPPKNINKIIGKKALVNIPKNELLEPNMFQ